MMPACAAVRRPALDDSSSVKLFLGGLSWSLSEGAPILIECAAGTAARHANHAPSIFT